MVIFMDKQQRALRLKSKTGRMVLFMTLSVLIIMAGVMGVARFSLKLNRTSKDLAASKTITIEDKTGLNELEADLLLKLADSTGNTPALLYLMQYYRNNELKLSKEDVSRMNELIKDLEELIHLEGHSQVTEMSLDGREVYFYILVQVYEMSGLKVIISNDSNIEQVSDRTGSILYQDSTQQQNVFQVGTLIITVCAILVMISICFTIARRNQLFGKDVDYHGVKEKRVA